MGLLWYMQDISIHLIKLVSHEVRTIRKPNDQVIHKFILQVGRLKSQRNEELT